VELIAGLAAFANFSGEEALGGLITDWLARTDVKRQEPWCIG
jgi:hypothetical protein